MTIRAENIDINKLKNGSSILIQTEKKNVTQLCIMALKRFPYISPIVISDKLEYNEYIPESNRYNVYHDDILQKILNDHRERQWYVEITGKSNGVLLLIIDHSHVDQIMVDHNSIIQNLLKNAQHMKIIFVIGIPKLL